LGYIYGLNAGTGKAVYSIRMFTSFLFNKLSHLRQFYSTETEFTQHLLSGEVKVSIPDLITFQEEYEKQKPISNSSGCILPSQFQIGDKASLKLTGLSSKGDGSLATVDCIAEILTVHFYEGKVKYDLELPLDFGNTRVYNIDSVFVSPV